MRWTTEFEFEGLRKSGTAIGATLVSETGRTLAFLDDPIWGEELEQVIAKRSLTPKLVDAYRNLIKSWNPDVTCVVPMPSSRNAQLISELAEVTSETLGMPIVDLIEMKAPSKQASSTSLNGRPAEIASRIGLKPGARVRNQNVLLVDDSHSTKWTLTIAGALLRLNGAKSVTPITLYERPSGQD
jgi:predicted amidophosphoribosyltransferase